MFTLMSHTDEEKLCERTHGISPSHIESEGKKGGERQTNTDGLHLSSSLAAEEHPLSISHSFSAFSTKHIHCLAV